MMPRRGAGRPKTSERRDGRAALLEAARALLSERGLDRVSLRDVAERAGVQPPLVHYHFGSKSELFEAVVVEISQGLRDRIASASEAAGTPEQRLRALVSNLIHALAEDPYAARLMTELVVFPDDERSERFLRDFGAPNLAALERILADGERDGSLAAWDLRAAAPALFGACLYYFLSAPVLRRLLDFDPLQAEAVARYAESVGEVLARGLRRPPAP